MNKKIFAIVILGSLLLTSVAGLSATGLNVENETIETSYELPDLTISLSAPEKGVLITTVDNNADVTGIKTNPCLNPEIIYIEVYKLYLIDGEWKEAARPCLSTVRSFYNFINNGNGIPAHYHEEDKLERQLPKYSGIGPSFRLRVKAYTDVVYGDTLFNLIEESDETNNYAEITMIPAGIKSRSVEPSFFSLSGDVFLSDDMENLEIKVDGQPLNIYGIESDQVFKNVTVTGTQLETDHPSFAFAPRCSFIGTMILAMVSIFDQLLPNKDLYSHIFDIVDVLPGFYVFPTGEFIVNVGTMKDFCDTGFGGYIFNGLNIQIEE